MHKKPEIKQTTFGEIKPWGENPKTIQKRELEDLAESIKKLGNFQVLTCWPVGKTYETYPKEDTRKYQTGGGNMRWHAMKTILKVPADSKIWISLSFPENEAERLELSLRDNQRYGSYDMDKLAEMTWNQMGKIDISEFRIDIGKSTPLESIMTQYGPRIDVVEEDTVPAAEVVPITELGDLFQLGPHFLLCGDACAPWAYTALMGEEKADLVFTDPPYNVAYEGQKFKQIMNDEMDPEAFVQFTLQFMNRLQENTRKGGVFYICSGYSSYPTFVYAIKAAGMYYSGPIIWVKNQTSFGWEDYKKKHEMILKAKTGPKKAQPILYGWNGGRHYFAEDKLEADVWEMKRRASVTMMHPTQKPLGIVQRAIRNSSKLGDIVLDSFGGSGSTLIGAEREGRTARVMELDPIFCDVIIRRYANLGAFTEAEIRKTKKKIKIDVKPAEEAREKGKK